MIKVSDLADSSVVIETDAELNDNTMAKIKELLAYIYEVRDNAFIQQETIKTANGIEDIEDDEEGDED